MLNGDAMRFGSGPSSSGESVSVVTTKVYTGTANYDSANIGTTGATLVTIPAGVWITDIWMELVTPWNNAGPLAVGIQDHKLVTNGTDATTAESQLGSSSGFWYSAPDLTSSDNQLDGDKLSMGFTSDGLSIMTNANSGSNPGVPMYVNSEVIFKVIVATLDDAENYDPPTMGQVKYHFLVAEVDS